MSEFHFLSPLIRRWSQHTRLSAEDHAALIALPWTRKVFGKDSYMAREGQLTTDCMLLLKGFAYRQKLLRDGSRQIISFHVPTEFIDLQNCLLGVADHNLQALGRAEVALIAIDPLTALMQARPAIRMAIWKDTLIDASIFREWVVNVGRRDARTRIAHLLCEMALRLDRLGMNEGRKVDFPLTQEQLADATGLTSVHTNRTLQGLRKDGLIALSNGSLSVLDWDGLRAAGDFDELYLHQQI